VGDDGRALLALPAPGELRVAERPPGGTFGAPVTIARLRADGVPQAAVSLGADGRAAIVWTTLANGDAWMVTRDRTGAFGRVTELSRARTPRPTRAVALLIVPGGGARGLGEESHVAVTLTPGGVLAAWLAARDVAGAAATGVRTAFVPAAGGPVQRSLVGGGLRDASSVVTFPTGDGGAGVAWLEPGAHGHALLHAALAGGARPADPPTPVVQFGPPLERALKYGRPLRLPVTCGAACDVRAQIAGGRADGELSLVRAGHGVLHVYPERRPFATPRGGPVRLRLFYGATGAAHPARRTVSLRLRLRTPAPLPHPYDLRALPRPGDRLRVTWSTATADRRAFFLVYGLATRGGPPRALNAAGHTARRHFALTLAHVRGVHFVELHAYAADGRPARTLTVRVRGASATTAGQCKTNEQDPQPNEPREDSTFAGRERDREAGGPLRPARFEVVRTSGSSPQLQVHDVESHEPALGMVERLGHGSDDREPERAVERDRRRIGLGDRVELHRSESRRACP
jgi:hypothetical protein